MSSSKSRCQAQNLDVKLKISTPRGTFPRLNEMSSSKSRCQAQNLDVKLKISMSSSKSRCQAQNLDVKLKISMSSSKCQAQKSSSKCRAKPPGSNPSGAAQRRTRQWASGCRGCLAVRLRAGKRWYGLDPSWLRPDCVLAADQVPVCFGWWV